MLVLTRLQHLNTRLPEDLGSDVFSVQLSQSGKIEIQTEVFMKRAFAYPILMIFIALALMVAFRIVSISSSQPEPPVTIEPVRSNP